MKIATFASGIAFGILLKQAYDHGHEIDAEQENPDEFAVAATAEHFLVAIENKFGSTRAVCNCGELLQAAQDLLGQRSILPSFADHVKTARWPKIQTDPEGEPRPGSMD
jgi:hypothetical protein